MTMPAERTRALRWAGEILSELQQSDQIDDAVKRQIRVILRHFPTCAQIEAQAEVSADGGPSAWLAPERLL
jgi:hypothetical protein